MSEDFDPRPNFAGLRDFLRGVTKRTLKRITNGKYCRVKASRPQQFCGICARVFDHVTSHRLPLIKKGICPECRSELADGKLGIVCGPKVFWGAPADPKNAGKWSKCPEKHLDSLLKLFNESHPKDPAGAA